MQNAQSPPLFFSGKPRRVLGWLCPACFIPFLYQKAVLRFTSTDGFEILVGRNNAQNDKLTLHTARGKDLWFHVQKAPGSHVVVMSRGEDIPDSTKQEAAELAVLYSSAFKAGTGAKVAVDTTEVKNIWKANGAKPGMVLYEVYTTVYITPREGLEEQLKKK